MLMEASGAGVEDKSGWSSHRFDLLKWVQDGASTCKCTASNLQKVSNTHAGLGAFNGRMVFLCVHDGRRRRTNIDELKE